MTEADWNECDKPHFMVLFLQRDGEASQRKLRLFSAACCRRVWHRLVSRPSRIAVEFAERYADGELTRRQLRHVHQSAKSVLNRPMELWEESAAAAAVSATDSLVGAAPILATCNHAARASDLGTRGEWLAQAPLFRDVFGPTPFRPLTVDFAMLNPVVPLLARAAYEERVGPGGRLDAEKLAILADALEENGCTDVEVLQHLRDPNLEHVRGCWVVDLLIGKE